MDADQHRCGLCGCPARTGYPGAVCARCARTYGFQKPIPHGFYDTPALRRALASYDFGAVFTAIRAQTGLSQLKLAGLLGLAQSRISDVERGQRRLRDVALIARIATALGIPARLLGFHTDSLGTVEAEEVNWVDRRDFLSLITAATLGSGLHPELARLDALVPSHAEPATRPRIGDADIDAIETIIDGLRQSASAYGGGLCRTAAVAQLKHVRRLRDARCTEQVRTRLQLATADLAMMTAYLSFDVEEHDAARRLWALALDTAHHAEEHHRSTDLSVNVLLDITEQTLHLGRPQEALRVMRLASATAASGKYPVTAVTKCLSSLYLAWCWAALDEVEPCRQALGQAMETHADADPNAVPHWAQWISGTEIAALHGHSLLLLSLANGEFAPSAITQLRTAVDGFDTSVGRARAVNMPGLAAAYFRAGDLDSAVATGRLAVNAIGALSCDRAYARLRVLDSVADPVSHNADVAELREHIRSALPAA